MATGTSIFLIALGAILTFAVDVSVQGLDLAAVGVILMIGGSIPGETRVLSISIYDSVQAFRIDQAGVMAAALLVFSIAAIAIVHMLARRPKVDAHGA